ncbi:MAG: ABC transporter ATP-binding protein [Candidatus Rokubacteria bacterium]|nr:ABC transporter ATP-binding protein [Candidatus Rokubacteria bacterium]
MRSGRFGVAVRAHLWSARWRLALATLCMLGVTATALLGPWPLKLIFDHVLLDAPLPSSLWLLGGLIGGSKTTAVAALASSILLVAALRGAFAYGQVYLTSRVGYGLVYALRHEAFAHLQRLSLSFYHRSRSGELLSKITADTNTLREVFSDAAVTFAGHVLTVAGMWTVMLALNWRLAAMVLASLPLLAWTLVHLQRGIRGSAKRQRKQEGRIAARLAEMLASMALVQAFARERYEAQRFEAESAANLEDGIRVARMEAAAARSVEIGSALAISAVVLFGALQVLEGRMSPGGVLVFAAYLGSMYKPLRGMARLSGKFAKASVSAQRLAEFLDEEPEVRERPDAIEAGRLRGEIVFDGVSFDYGAGRPVLKDVSFRIPPGQRAVIVGASGAGKSTLVSLILRLYDPRAGRILLDGVDIAQYRRESIRRQVGIVLQESMLWGASIRENIAYGKPDATPAEIVAAAQAANAEGFIMGLENGYDTIVGERGAALSGGQRQRIAMARAMIRDAPILILDEPMRGLDVESERQAREALERVTAGRTCLLITHDLEEVTDTDLVLVLDDGKIAAQGRHRTLLSTSLLYRRTYELATGRRDVKARQR